MSETVGAKGNENDHHMRLLIDAAPVAMLVVNRHGRITVANSRAVETFGYPVGSLIGMSVDDLVPEGLRAGHGRMVDNFFMAMVPRVMGVGRDVIAVDAQGHEFPVEIGLSPVQTPDGPIVVAAIVNITERKRRDKESTLARIVQEAMLPDIPTDLPGIELAARSDPADATGGDFYDLHRLPDGQLEIIIGDASGHGFAAALVTVAARSYLRALGRLESDVGRILKKANLLLIEDVLESRFVTLLFAIYDPQRKTLTYSGAGHLGYLLKPDGELQCLLDQNGPPLGWFVDSEYPVTTLPLQPGNLVVLLTDGIEEAMNPDGIQFGRQRVLDLLRRERAAPVSQIVQSLHAAVHEYCGPSRPTDDTTVIVARIR